MDSSNGSAASSGRYGGSPSASRRRKHTRLSKLPISCVDSSLQARVVMEQICRERSQIYQQSVVQTVLGPHHEGHRKPSDSKPKLKFPNIDDKTQLGVSEREELPKMETLRNSSAVEHSTAAYLEPLPHATRRRVYNKILHNSVPSCDSAGSSAGRASVGVPQRQFQRRPRAAVHRNGAVLRHQPTADRNPSDTSTRLEEYFTNPRRREVRRRYTPDVVPRRTRSQSSGRGMTNPPVLQTRKRRGSNLDAGRSQSDQDIPSTDARLKTQPNLQRKTRHLSKSQDSLQRPTDNHEPGPSQTNLGPSDWQLAREKSFEITFPGYDTRFVDLPDPNTLNERAEMNDIDRQIESQIHASSVEKCRQWLNKWVLTT